MRSRIEERFRVHLLFGSENLNLPIGDWWRERGTRDYEKDYHRAQHYLLNVNPDTESKIRGTK
jgi:hypothetical protein